MSDERETSASRAAETPETLANPGAPVVETEASKTEVLEALQRSRDAADSNAAASDATDSSSAGGAEAVTTVVPEVGVSSDSDSATGSDVASSDAAVAQPVPAVATTPIAASGEAEPTAVLSQAPTTLDDLPTAAESPTLAATPERDGEIRISADHPMADFYVQTPTPPDIRGNRGAGVLISILATIGFAAVFAGVVALSLAPSLAPSQFVDGLLSNLMTWDFIAPVVAFLVGMVLLVLIVGRAGWWAYVLGGFFVAALVWVAAAYGALVQDEGIRAMFVYSPIDVMLARGVDLWAFGAAVVAREASVWFGAWIGARGRKIKQRNALALAEYETALAEAQAKRS